ncbi:hypothetical protein [Flindersiella endophytica]
MADYSSLEMPVLAEIAQTELNNAGTVRNAAQLWGAAPGVLSTSHGALSGATNTLGENWQDETFEVAFKAPVDEGLASIKNSEQILSQAKPDQVLQQLAGQIETTGSQVDQLHQQWLKLQQLLQQLMAMAAASPLAAAILAPIIKQIQDLMEQLRMQAAGHVTTLAQNYQQGGQAVQAAGQGHAWNGPAAGSPPSPGADSDELTAARPFQTVTSLQPDAGQAGTTQADQLRQAQLDAARAAENAADNAANANAATPVGSDTGLAGGVATAPAPSTIPPVSTPPAAPATTGTAPGSLPLGGTTAPIGRVGGYGSSVPLTPAARSGGSIQRAARVTGGITVAGSGQAPVLPETPAARGSSSRGSAGVPMGAMPLSPLALGKLQDLIGRLKPVVTPHGRAVDVESKRVAGVPNALRGRSGSADDEFAMSNGQRGRRSRKETDDAPATVELLDEELWEIEQQTTATRPTR